MVKIGIFPSYNQSGSEDLIKFNELYVHLCNWNWSTNLLQTFDLYISWTVLIKINVSNIWQLPVLDGQTNLTEQHFPQ